MKAKVRWKTYFVEILNSTTYVELYQKGHSRRSRGRIFPRDTYSGHYLASTVPLHTYLFSVISRRQQQHSREWQRQQPLVVSCPRALTLCNSIILYVNSCACYSSAAATIDKKNTRQLRQVIFPQLYKQMFEKLVWSVDEVVAIHTWWMGSQRPLRRTTKGGGAVAMV